MLSPAIIEIANAKHTLIERIKTCVIEWKSQPTFAAFFGSAARKYISVESDIDTALIFPNNADHDLAHSQVYQLVDQVTRWTGNDTRPLIYREQEITPSPLFESIMEEAIVLAGSMRPLSQLTSSGLS